MNEISTIQEGILLTQNIYSSSSLYNVGGYAHIKGAINSQLLIKCIESVLKQADILTSAYNALNSSKQEDAKEKYDILFEDLSGKDILQDTCTSWIDRDISKRFEPDQGLFKVVLFKVSVSEYYLYAKVHHLACDGYSMALFFNSVSTLYASRVEPGVSVLRQKLFPYSDFLLDEKEYKASKEFDDDRKFWQGRLDKILHSKAFESGFHSTNTEILKSKDREIKIKRDIFDKIDRFCKQHHCTPFHYFLLIIFILNEAYNNQTPVIGLPILNRRRGEFKNTLGAFINILPFSFPVKDGIPFVHLLVQLRNELNQCYRHSRFPLLETLKAVGVKGNVYNCSFSYQKNSYANRLGSAEIEVKYTYSNEQQEDIAFHLLEYSSINDLTFSITYKEALFSEQLVIGLIGHFQNLIESLYMNPQFTLSQMDYMNDGEEQKLKTLFGPTEKLISDTKTIVELFEDQVKKTPHNTALNFEDINWSYTVLNKLANGFGNFLRTALFVNEHDFVGVNLRRDQWLPVVILGILKAGAVCVPIDHEFPQSRKDYIVQNSQCKTSVGFDHLNLFIRESSSFPAENLGLNYQPTDLCFVIYTSGSTGRPKGCMLENIGIANHLFSKVDLLKMDEGSVICHNSEMHFVGSLWQLLCPLIVGGKLCLCGSEDLKNLEVVVSKAEAHGATVLEVIPSQLKEFLRASPKKIETIETIILTGEKLYSHFTNNCYSILGVSRLINTYGQTECSDVTTSYVIPKDFKNIIIPVGKPVRNTQIYILSSRSALVPIGVLGEICTSGYGISRGYLNDPELTSRKFIPNPYDKEQLLYKTGDLGRWLSDGNIEVVGRCDEQVKIRGCRVELEEIRNALLQYEGVEQVGLIFNESGPNTKHLIAFLVSKFNLDYSQVSGFLAGYLPYYMIPNRYARLDNFPLLANGKVDRGQLLRLSQNMIDLAHDYLPPTNDVEASLEQIWSKIFDKPKVGIKDNFFELGGHSLYASTMINQINNRFEINLSIKQVFRCGCIQDLAAEVQKAVWAKSMSITQQDGGHRDIIRL